MKVETVGTNKFKIYLTSDEIEFIFGDYESINYSGEASKAAMHSLLKIALPSCAYPLNCDRIMIEVKPQKGGCCIFFTKIYAEKVLKEPAEKNLIMISFENSEKMICAICELYKQKLAQISELFYISDRYYLIIKEAQSGLAESNCIEPYREKVTKDAVEISYIKEYGVPVCRENAVNKIGSVFNKKST